MSSIRLSRAAALRNAAVSFCSAFTAFKTPERILAEHFVADDPKITEHGPSWATGRLPFLGHTFAGLEMCLQYFKLLGDTLAFEPDADTFPNEDGFIVDENAVPIPSGDTTNTALPDEIDFDVDDEQNQGEPADRRGVVTVVAQGKFKSVKTGRGWNEKFMYRLSGFDEAGRIGHWEIWADPLSAWVAVGDDNAGKMDQQFGD